METLFDILAALGVGAAAGLAPLVALAAVVLLAAIHVGVNPAGSDFNFVDDVVAVVVAAIVLAQSLLADLAGNTKFRIAADHRIHPLVHGLTAVTLGALGGLVVFAASDQPRVVGAVIGALGALTVVWFGSAFFGRVSDRVKRQAATATKGDGEAGKGRRGDAGAVALAVDLLTVAAVAIAMIVPPLGVVLPVLALLTALGRRRKQEHKYEGLRSLR